jgi:L-alanine-DL-glutamate epimerase-like enolase superfamily enzyme
MSVRDVDDVRDFDSFLKSQCEDARSRLADLLAPHRLTVAECRVHRVLIPMVGTYTPGFQALPAASWAFVELATHEGLTGTGEWPIDLPRPTRLVLDEIQDNPGTNVLMLDYEEPLFMAWWDLVGQVLGRPLHRLWADLFDVGFDPPARVPLAAYSWPRFPDAAGNDAVAADTWPSFALSQVDEGYTTLKVSMTSYDPDEYVDILRRIRATVPADVDIRIDAHGSWNFTEARRILPQLESLRISYFEQPFNALLPSRFYRAPTPTRRSGYQPEFYFRKLEELRRHTTIPFSDHWWTPPIVQPDDATHMANRWEVDWYMLERYDPVDISNPDIWLGVFGLWRLLNLARFMGLHVTLHSNFELGVQTVFRSAMFSALGYYPESAGLYMGTTPRLCLAMDTEYNQVSDDVLVNGKLPFVDGHVELSQASGHGLRLDPDRLARYAYTAEAVAPHRNYAEKLFGQYRLDRPRRKTFAGWPKASGPERVDRLAYPYDLRAILGLDHVQDVDVELNT